MACVTPGEANDVTLVCSYVEAETSSKRVVHWLAMLFSRAENHTQTGWGDTDVPEPRPTAFGA